MSEATTQRRQLVVAALSLAAGASGVITPTTARSAQAALQKLPELTEGPFYPPRRWRAPQSDWDADLTRVRAGGQSLVAQGEHLGLELRVVDSDNKPVDRLEFEIWQCDIHARYRHPSERDDGKIDAGFQGFGAAQTDAQGRVSFRTIRPVPYPGRTPHIHIKLRHASFGELTSQLFVAGESGNSGDFIWRRLGAQRQSALDMVLRPIQADGLRWQARHTLVVGT